MGTKAKPGAYDCYAKAGDDEPIFVLRANDPHAPDVVRVWAHARYHPAEWNDPKFREAIACARAMEDWRAKQNPTDA